MPECWRSRTHTSGSRGGSWRRNRSITRGIMRAWILKASLCAAAAAAPLSGASGQRVAPRVVTAAGSVRGDAFFAPSLGVRKHFMVYLPPSYDAKPAMRYPVAYYLHGLSGSETDWLSRAGIDAVADSLIGSGLPEMIIVMPDGDDSWYAAPEAVKPYETCRDSIRSESAERGCVKSARYAEYIARDLVA